MKVLLKLLSHSWLLPGTPVWLLLCVVYFAEAGGGISMLKSGFTVRMGRGPCQLHFLFFVNFREVLAVTRFEILQVRVLEPLGEPAFLVSF